MTRTNALAAVDAFWRAANYLSVGQIYLMDNPLLRVPLEPEHVKPRLLGHWGTTPGLTFVYAHLNRLIAERDLDMIFVTGPGHGGPGIVASTYLEGTYAELFPAISEDEEGLRRLFTQFSFPGGIPSHTAPETPGSINEGGELGYSLAHAFGAAFDNPDLVVACVVGDGEAETGPLAAAWHSNKFLNPRRDGAVLPILHLNGYKIANPTVLARIGRGELENLFRGYGYDPRFVAGDDPALVHAAMYAALDRAHDDIVAIRRTARSSSPVKRPIWPMIVLETPKGWTGPKEVDGQKTEGTWRSHQVPLAEVRTNPEHLRLLEGWLKSYRPEALFDADGRIRPIVREAIPTGERRMGANPHANGGRSPAPLRLPDPKAFAIPVEKKGTPLAENTRPTGHYLREVFERNRATSNFRLFGPDETASNRLSAVFSSTNKAWVAETLPSDEHLGPDGRVMEILSEHTCEGWLEGYVLTGRHGVFSTYEAFVHIIDSMFNQHAKWLQSAAHVPWRRAIPSLNLLLSSHVWRQDHNGISHQDPGFIDLVVNKKPEVVRVYLAPDANTLLVALDRCLRTENLINVIVAGKHPAPQWLSMPDAERHVAAGIGAWGWAGNHADREPHVVLACAGDVPTMEVLAAAMLLREHLPDLAVRVVNVVDLMTLQPDYFHPHGLPDAAFDALFTGDRPVIFAYHGYPWLIHRLAYRRRNHGNMHVRGYREEGSTTTPFDMVTRNGVDRFHLVLDVIERVPGLSATAGDLASSLRGKLEEHASFIRRTGEDLPEIRNWTWQ